MSQEIKFAFFGSSRFSVIVLDELMKSGLKPALVVTTPDKPKGRKLVLTPTEVKTWALEKGIKVFDPAKLSDSFAEELARESARAECGTFVVASYGKIIPASILNIPKRGVPNIHPSLLPKYRGASPLQSAMLDDEKNTGITIMRIDEEMDHGPIIAQTKFDVAERFGDWPVYGVFEEAMAREGAKLLAKILPDWISSPDKVPEMEQEHEKATYTRKIKKEDGLIDITGNARQNFLKVQAYNEWPGAYFFADKQTGNGEVALEGVKKRIKITRASYSSGKFNIEKVIPEGGKEIDYSAFVRNQSRTA